MTWTNWGSKSCRTAKSSRGRERPPMIRATFGFIANTAARPAGNGEGDCQWNDRRESRQARGMLRWQSMALNGIIVLDDVDAFRTHESVVGLSFGLEDGFLYRSGISGGSTSPIFSVPSGSMGTTIENAFPHLGQLGEYVEPGLRPLVLITARQCGHAILITQLPRGLPMPLTCNGAVIGRTVPHRIARARRWDSNPQPLDRQASSCKTARA